MRLFTSESVMSGHPDKVADLISDTILDACLTVDPDARVACETLVCPDTVVLAGEITCKDFPEYVNELVKGTIVEIGYGPHTPGFDPTSANFGIINKLHAQSRDIAMGVDTGGAGDQGIMFGYACNETPSMMPFPIYAAHEIGKAVSMLRHDPSAPWVRPDGKTQVSVNYREDGSIALDNVLVSISHAEGVSQSTIRKKITEVVDQLISSWTYVDSSEYNHEQNLLVNPTGLFSIYGPVSDSGLTGRKIIVDTYGGSCAHGGGAFCFVGDTLVHTESGLVKIKDVKPGMQVWTINEETGERTLNCVRAVIENTPENSEDLVEIGLANGDKITVTHNHEIFVKGKGWVRAGDLHEGDDLLEIGNIFT